MAEKRVVVTAAEGLHARPAAELVRLARAHPGSVTVRAEGRGPVDAASVLAVMTLGVSSGDEVVVDADGPEAAALLEQINDLLDPPRE